MTEEATPAPSSKKAKAKAKRKRSFAYSQQMGGPAVAEVVLAKAYRQFFSSVDGEIILSDLTRMTGYFRRPTYSEWMINLKRLGPEPEAFTLHSALSNARAEVVQHILDYLNMSDDDLIALEKAARLERGR